MYEMVCKDAASFGVTTETVEKRQHAQFPPRIPTLFSPALLPLGLHNDSLNSPDKSTLAEKKYQGTKALYVMLSSCIDFFFPPVYLTDNVKSLLHVMSSWASEIASALPVALNALVEMCLGRGIVERR